MRSRGSSIEGTLLRFEGQGIMVESSLQDIGAEKRSAKDGSDDDDKSEVRKSTI